ncbi:MAG: XdhC family protein [Salinivirgaceae bacterium]|nr:XdhC family protein [Salinivirgaceae bacterium]MDD4747813.1 XdhC family protein [Salinivirgaceae bacterium]MDY0282225.1 XdhC family protein [Salinivirgaceae bacterium]
MSDILHKFSQILKSGKSFVLCVIVSTEGSSPRKAGAKMIIYNDATIEGTIGGGSIEKQAIEHAPEILKTGNPEVKSYQLEADFAMQCGGGVTLYFEPFYPNPDLYIFGAGHIGREVGRYAVENGFNIIFVDNRPTIFQDFDASYANIILGDYMDSLDKIEFKPTDYAVVMTPQHEFDEKITLRLAKENIYYLGMIGSKRKVAEFRRNAIGNNILTDEDLKKIDMPIGIPFNAQTPREIAISILAKIIDVKNSAQS